MKEMLIYLALSRVYSSTQGGKLFQYPLAGFCFVLWMGPCVVHQNVNPAVSLYPPLGHFLSIFPLGDICLDGNNLPAHFLHLPLYFFD